MMDFSRLVDVIRTHADTGLLPRRLRNASLSPSTTVGELGLDSLGTMTLLTALMEETGSYFADNAFSPRDTLADVLRICAEGRSP